jgi:hypothetical protein
MRWREVGLDYDDAPKVRDRYLSGWFETSMIPIVGSPGRCGAVRSKDDSETR